ncbi:MAG: twin-arginine translocation signal domain-containing protein [Gemmatimonadetes bacterium]|nr:twin-arginine translocation signal domain-containing protein [Gemmatimonadota bacterium]
MKRRDFVKTAAAGAAAGSVPVLATPSRADAAGPGTRPGPPGAPAID